MMRLPFIGQSYQHRTDAVSAERTVNWILEMNQSGRGEMMLMGAPGIKSFVEVGDGPIQAMRFAGDFLWVVSGTEVYRVAADGSSAKVGDLEEDRPASISNNLTQVFFTNGANGYVINLQTGVLTRITDTDFSPSSSTTFQDGFALFVRDGTTQFFNSSIDDALTYDGLDFAEATQESDLVRAVVSDSKNVWVFKDRTIEIWFNNANPQGSPFSPQTGVTHTVGTRARGSCIRDRQGRVFWLGSDGVIYMSEGLQRRRVSNDGVEDVIASLGDVSDARAWSYTIRGKTCYTITFPSAGRTLEYRPDTQAWNDRESWPLGRWRANSIEEAWRGQTFVGDSQSGRVGLLSLDEFTEWGEPLEAYRICQHMHSDQAPVFMDTLEFVFQAGVGNDNDPGADPECILRMSDNNGRSWFGMLTSKLGKIGNTRQRAIFRRLGSYDVRTYRLSIKDPVRRDLIDVVGEAEVGVY